MATFNDFKPQVYEYEVVTPDGSTLDFAMKALTPAELLDIDLRHKRPDPEIVEFRPPEKKGDKPSPIYESDPDAPDDAKERWSRKMNMWLQEHRNIQTIQALQMDIPGETEAEKLEALTELGAWAISAFSQALSLVTTTPRGALNARSFRGTGNFADEDM